MAKMTIYKDGPMYYTRDALLQLLKHDDILLIDDRGEGEMYSGTAGQFGTHKSKDLSDYDIIYYATHSHCGYIKLADKGFFDIFGMPAEDEHHEIEQISVKTSLID